MDYKGWKIPQRLYIYSKKYKTAYEYPQAMIASSEKENAIDTAKRWASGKYSGYTKEDYIEYIIDNEGIELEILDSANGSSQGGKLSFWNCILSKDNMKVVVGIGSDLLLELIRNSNFINGKCQDKLIMARIGQHWGALHKDMPQYQEAIADIKISNDFDNAKKTSSWEKGYEYYSKTQSGVYLYDLYVWRICEHINGHWFYSRPQYKITEFKKPKKIKVIEWTSWIKNKNITSLSELMKNGGGKYSSEYYKEYLKLPPRIKGEKILDIDLTASDIDILLQKNREKNENQYFSSQPNWFSYVINSFGVSANPNERPELSERLLEEIKKKGVEIINE